MGYSEVTGELEKNGWKRTFIDLFGAADRYDYEAVRLEAEYKKALASKAAASSNLENLIMAMFGRDELKKLIEINPDKSTLRVVSGNMLYVVEVISQDGGKDKLIKWNKYPVEIVPEFYAS
jgi:hypothetical protein